jgi:hypothetical protein
MSARRGVTIHKVTIKFSADQITWLNDISRERSVSVSDIIRRLVDETRGAYLTPADARLAEHEGVTKST